MNAVTAASNRILRFGLTALLTMATMTASGQVVFRRQNPRNPFPRRPAQNRPFANKQIKRAIDPEAVRLLKAMAKARVPYAGEEVTERGGRTARQQIWGDAKGRIRRDFLAPEEIAGDILLNAPDTYRYYHKRENVQDVAFWPAGAGDEWIQRVGNLLQQGIVAAAKVGEEIIAGRSTDIVAVSADRLVGGSGAQVKYWIDKETGIALKREMSNAMGLVSRSYLTTVQIGTDAVPQGTFNPAFIQGARVRPLFPKESQFASVEETRSRLPFTPVQPSELPAGFRLTGVWVLTPQDTPRRNVISILLRYSDGVTAFCLAERMIPVGAKAPAALKPKQAFRRPIQIWPVNSSNNEPLSVVYIGHLTPAQVETLHDSLK